MGCCCGGRKSTGNRKAKNVLIPGTTRTKLSKIPRAGTRKRRRAQGQTR